MFSINIYLRFALIVGGFLLGIGLWAAFGWGYGILFLLVGIAMLVGYFLLGTVQSAAMMLQTQDFDGAEQRLALTYFPQWLFGPNRAYFFLLKGTLAMQRKEYEAAEAFYAQSQAIGLPSDNEKGMILLQLANIRAMKQKWQEAKNYIRQAKDLKITEPMLKEQLRQMEQGLNQGTQAQSTMMRQGGFRPNYRPKR